MNPCLDATEIDVGFAEINLGAAWRMRQRNKNLLLPQAFLANKFSYHGIAALIAVLVA